MGLSEHTLERDAAEQLRRAGFPFVQVHARLQALGRVLEADVVAWDVNDKGELQPLVLVEAKQGFGRWIDGQPDRARDVFRQVSAYANAFGTKAAYIRDETGWYRVASTFDSAEPSTPPSPSGLQPTSPLPDALVTQLLTQAAWRLTNEVRKTAEKEVLVETVLEPLLAELEAQPTVPELSLLPTPRNGPAMLRALFQDVLPRVQSRRSYTTPWAISVAMARLARPKPNALVRDPFCGLGGCLWAIAEQAPSLNLRGSDVSPALANFALRLGALADYDITVENEDALIRADDLEADVVISDPPLHRKLATPQLLACGGSTSDGDFLVLDRAHRWLRSGGRAVLLLTRGVLVRDGLGEKVRSFLQSNARISALISLPAGVLKPYTNLQPVLLVLDKVDPGETLVARLGDDWQEQLGPSGEFFASFLQHTEESA